MQPSPGQHICIHSTCILGPESKAPPTVDEEACPESHLLSKQYTKRKSEIGIYALYCMYCTTVVLYVGSETAWHCLYCKMRRKKLGWARVCVTVWECVDRLSEKSSNYDELAGYWFLDEFLSCLASIMSVIHAAPHGTPRTGRGWRLWEGEQHQEMFPNTLESEFSVKCENSTLSSKAQ